MSTRFITAEKLAALVADLNANGTRVIAPVVAEDGRATYSAIQQLAEATFNAELPTPSLKAHFLPPNEALLAWRQRGGDVELEPASTEFAPQVILGARPCDAAALDIVDAVMNWDYHDQLWNGRRAASTVIAMACPGIDESCFCSAVGLAPDATRGADALFTPVDGGFLAETTTERGEDFLAANAAYFADASEQALAAGTSAREAASAKVAENFSADMDAISSWIGSHFDDEFWRTLGARCNGCGSCASVCPTCHCFDIVDEPAGVGAGVRRRAWDSCQSGIFTLHASGHNPRADQNARFRQRVSHKFHIYPSKFGAQLCTGCGRCIRQCPVGQDLIEILQQIDTLAASEKEGVA